MTDHKRHLSNRTLLRQVLAAWVVAVWVVAVGAFLLVFHDQRGEEQMVPRWHMPPVAGAEEWDDDLPVRHGPGWALPQSGTSTAPNTPPDQR